MMGFASLRGSYGDFEENDWPGESVEAETCKKANAAAQLRGGVGQQQCAGR